MWIPYKSEFTSTSQGHIASSLPPLWSWQPVILDRTSKVWNLILWSSKWKRAIPSRITGTFTVFVKAKRAPWLIVVFITSHGNKFQRTPVTNSCTSASVDLSHQLEQGRYLTPTSIFYCQFIFIFVCRLGRHKVSEGTTAFPLNFVQKVYQMLDSSLPIHLHLSFVVAKAQVLQVGGCICLTWWEGCCSMWMTLGSLGSYQANSLGSFWILSIDGDLVPAPHVLLHAEVC